MRAMVHVQVLPPGLSVRMVPGRMLFSSGDGALDGDAGGQPDGADLLLRDAPCPGWYRIPDGTRDSFAGDQDGVWMS